MKLIVTFIALSAVNVVFSTIRSLITVKGNKWIASIINAGYFAFYNIMLIYTVADFPLWQKCVITFSCNLVGVFVVKFAEEKARKEMLWKIEFAVRGTFTGKVDELLELAGIPHNYISEVGKHTIFNAYCATSKQSESVKEIIKQYKAKYFVTETKLL